MHNKKQLGRNSRLSTQSNFQDVFKKGKKLRFYGFSVLVCKNDLTFSRVGITVPKKQIPRAVDRNRIKRIFRESFRQKRSDLNTCLDMVFVVYSTIMEKSNLEIYACLDELWAKLILHYGKV